MAGRQVLTLFIEVRILVPEQFCRARNALCENRIDDDARGRAPPRPQRRPRSRSGDGAWLKSRRCWFDSRRGHSRESPWVAIWDQAGLQNRPAGFDSPAACNGGVERAARGVCRGRQAGKATGCKPVYARVRAPPSTRSDRAQGVPGCTLARQVRGAGSSPAGRSRIRQARVAEWSRPQPSKLVTRVRFPPRAQDAGRAGPGPAS
jgi:hypothetical protein